MTLPAFFIDRPVFASILNLMIVVVGLISLTNISLREYPDIDVPRLQVQTFYPNASPELVESRITDPLEDALASVSGLSSIESQSHSNRSEITLSLKPGVSIDAKIIEIRDAIEKIRGRFPEDVQIPTIEKSGDSEGPPFIAVSFISDSLSPQDLTHYISVHFKNLFRSISGVSSAEIWSQGFAMGITLDPKRLFALGLDITEVTSALKNKNLPFSAGKLHKEIPISLATELKTEDDFKNLVVKNQTDLHPPILLKHVADVRLVEDKSSFRININGKSGGLIAIKLNSDGNPLTVSRDVNKLVASLQESLPKGLSMSVCIDNANFIRASLSNIQKSILEAAFLVLVIILVFIRNFRAALIPLLTIPISLIGVLGLFYALGLSINILTLLAIILAIGLVVDDAIVVLENIQRHIEAGLSPYDAALKGSREIGFAVVAMTLTLASVYAPIAFLQGITGALFKEFAIALSGAVLISGVVALTLSPMLCSRVLKPVENQRFPGFDIFMKNLTARYRRSLVFLMTKSTSVLAFLGVTSAALVALFYTLPEERAPAEDRGLVGLYAPPISGKSIDAMDALGQLFNAKMSHIQEADQIVSFIGSWGASTAIPLKPWFNRSKSASQVRNELQNIASQIPSASVYAWDWNSGLPGAQVGLEGGVQFVLKTSGSYQKLYEEADRFVKALAQNEKIKSSHQRLLLTSPGYDVKINTFQQSLLGISDQKIAKAIQVSANEEKNMVFMRDGLAYPIIVDTASDPDRLSEIYVMNKAGYPVSLSALAELIFVARPNALTHHNQMRSTTITVNPEENQKVGAIIDVIKAYQKDSLGQGFMIDWVGETQAALEGTKSGTLLLFLAIVFIFSILAIQFESLTSPLLIVLTVPLAAAGALFLMWICGVSLNIYSKIGLVTLIGLITKHGILLVEMAGQLQEKGLSLKEAAIKAAELRLRPILMTTGAMVFGVLPLAFSGGAGSEARQAIGLVLLGGLLFGTLMTLFVIPVIYALKKSK